MSMFIRKLPRLVTWKDYGITRKRLKELKTMCCMPEYASQTRCAAHRASEMLSEYILLSVREDVSYDKFDLPKYKNKLGIICVCRTDFYGYRRLFYHLFDRDLKGAEDMERYRIKKKKAKTDYYISEINIDYKKGYVATVDTVNRVAGCSARTCIESQSGKVLHEMIEVLCSSFPPAKQTGEIGEIIDFSGLLEGADEENA